MEALEQMPTYVKFMKDFLSKKYKIEDHKMVALTKECSAILQKKLPPKLKDPSSFSIPVSLGKSFSDRALYDLGASINLMPFLIFQKPGLKKGKIKPTKLTLQLAEWSQTCLRGITEDVLVKADKLMLLADFLILDREEDKEIPIILGRPFLATGRTLIDVQKGELIMRVQDQEAVGAVVGALANMERCSKLLIEDFVASSSNSVFSLFLALFILDLP
ncbi:DNA-directed DNA polymerase [Quillaja saponaria]|uniref:DNA-directed DNA polymerase n=1 Tax=Quillaja saponaria TaxID=32244 RepID=A0AAD7LVX5_QUISA|nr:DNA-directed DNA polymerase [Quillaja saponaria]